MANDGTSTRLRTTGRRQGTELRVAWKPYFGMLQQTSAAKDSTCISLVKRDL